MHAGAGTGRLRTYPEDFIVREWLGFDPDHDGEHALLTVRKRDANTQWVARELAKQAGARNHDVGFAGLKDRHAVTEQFFTVPIGRNGSLEEWLGFAGEGFEVIAAARHRRKLRRGAHRGNDFEILVRDFEWRAADGSLATREFVKTNERHEAPGSSDVGQACAERSDGSTASRADVEGTGELVGETGTRLCPGLAELLSNIQRLGVPNYFGEQRFGREDSNLETARRWFEEGHEPRDRNLRGFALSAARSDIFNKILAARVADGTWNQLLDGDVANLEGSGSIFTVETVDDVLRERCERMDIHPTGALWGRGELRTAGQVQQLEQSIAGELPAIAQGLAAAGLEQERRALRLPVHDLQWSIEDAGLRLRFRLTRGAYATTVLREIVNYDSWNTLIGSLAKFPSDFMSDRAQPLEAETREPPT